MICSRAATKSSARRFWAKLASILLLAVVSCRASRADEYSYIPPRGRSKAERAQRLRIKRRDSRRPKGITMSSTRSNHLEPLFEALTSEISAKWADLQSRIQSEQESACGVPALVPPTVPQPHAGSCRLLNLTRQRQGRAWLAEINRAVNFSIRPVSDWAQYGVADFWSAPLVTLWRRGR